MSTIHDLLALNRTAHSRLQMDRFITQRSGLTVYGMFKQSLRELGTRYQALKLSLILKRKAEIELKRLRLKRPKNKVENEQLDLDLTCQMSTIEDITQTLNETLRELTVFYGQAQHFRAQLPKVLDEATREALELETWVEYLKLELSYDYKAHGMPTRGTLEAVNCLPDKERAELLALTKGDDLSEILGYHENFKYPALPPAPDRMLAVGDKELGPSIQDAFIPRERLLELLK